MKGVTWPRSLASVGYCGRRISSITADAARNPDARRRVATAPGPKQVWCRDITWLPGPARWLFYYLYLMMDLYSRKIVAREIHEREAVDMAARLIRKTCLSERIMAQAAGVALGQWQSHEGRQYAGDPAAPGVTSSFGRPGVSNDNARAESLFRTCKYRPNYPVNGFAAIEGARDRVLSFSRWYNTGHKHSSLKFTTPENVIRVGQRPCWNTGNRYTAKQGSVTPTAGVVRSGTRCCQRKSGESRARTV